MPNCIIKSTTQPQTNLTVWLKDMPDNNISTLTIVDNPSPSSCKMLLLLEEAPLGSKGICSGFYCPIFAPAILYIGYGFCLSRFQILGLNP
jgi:hypothetical protein